MLGVCLGAQQLAAALGAPVTRGPAPEYGVGEVHLTTEAIGDPVFGPAPSPLPCVHWHGDTFGLPEGAVRLAGNDAYENQAFRVGARAYGLQFHVEVTASLVAHWGPHLPPGVYLRASDVAHVEPVPVTASCGASSPWPTTGDGGAATLSPPAGAARTAGCRRGGSTRPPSACRCAPITRNSVTESGRRPVAVTVSSLGSSPALSHVEAADGERARARSGPGSPLESPL